MSTAAEMRKHPLLKTFARVEKQATAIALQAPDNSAEGPVTSLVRQVFLSANAVRRTRVLFAAAGRETNLDAFVERVGKVLAEMTGATVALVESGPTARGSLTCNDRLPTGPESWRWHASKLTERMWRVPANLLPDTPTADQFSGGARAVFDNLPFDYILFAAAMNDSTLPLFCSHCQGSVLVLTANQTRRESALQAKRILHQCNAELLGTVLDCRQFPIPESIYRRL
jgi:hypothetical protein